MDLLGQEVSREKEVSLALWLVLPSVQHNSTKQIQKLSLLGYCIIVSVLLNHCKSRVSSKNLTYQIHEWTNYLCLYSCNLYNSYFSQLVRQKSKAFPLGCNNVVLHLFLKSITYLLICPLLQGLLEVFYLTLGLFEETESSVRQKVCFLNGCVVFLKPLASFCSAGGSRPERE